MRAQHKNGFQANNGGALQGGRRSTPETSAAHCAGPRQGVAQQATGSAVIGQSKLARHSREPQPGQMPAVCAGIQAGPHPPGGARLLWLTRTIRPYGHTQPRPSTRHAPPELTPNADAYFVIGSCCTHHRSSSRSNGHSSVLRCCVIPSLAAPVQSPSARTSARCRRRHAAGSAAAPPSAPAARPASPAAPRTGGTARSAAAIGSSEPARASSQAAFWPVKRGARVGREPAWSGQKWPDVMSCKQTRAAAARRLRRCRPIAGRGAAALTCYNPGTPCTNPSQAQARASYMDGWHVCVQSPQS